VFPLPYRAQASGSDLTEATRREAAQVQEDVWLRMLLRSHWEYLSSLAQQSLSPTLWFAVGARWCKAHLLTLLDLFRPVERVPALDDRDDGAFEPPYDSIQADDDTAYQAGGARIPRNQRARRAP
jgi:hypothetical protein